MVKKVGIKYTNVFDIVVIFNLSFSYRMNCRIFYKV